MSFDLQEHKIHNNASLVMEHRSEEKWREVMTCDVSPVAMFLFWFWFWLMGQSYLGQRIYYDILQGFVNIGGVLDGVVAFIWEYILVMIRWRWQMQNRIAVFEGFSLRELIKKRGVPMTEAQLHFLKLISDLQVPESCLLIILGTIFGRFCFMSHIIIR